MQKIQLALLDQDDAWRDALSLQVHEMPEFQLCISTNDPTRFSSLLAYAEVQVAILDEAISMNTLLKIVAYAKRKYPDILLVFRANADNCAITRNLQRAGIQHIIDKSNSLESLFCLIRTCFLLPNQNYKQQKSEPIHVQEIFPIYSKRSQLSPREAEVLGLLCAEKTNREIAEILKLSTRTVEGYRKNIQEKVGARNLAGLVLYAVREGLVSY